VADSFLSRWFGGKRAAGPEVERLRAELDRLGAERPGLLPLARWLAEMLPDLAEAPASLAAPTIEPERAAAKLESGIPLLRGERLSVDWSAFQRRWRRGCAALQAQDSTADTAMAQGLADAVRDGRLDPAEMVAAVVAGRPESVRERAEQLGLDPAVACTLLRFTLCPLFTAMEASLAPLRTRVVWERGYCPTCGSWPLLGEFRGLDQSRFLRCGLCAAGWEVPRLWCPFCDNRDHERLGFLFSEGEESKYRVSTCDACHGYVKMVSSLMALSPLQMLVADVATVHLDLAAAERGCTNQF
jgi:FdhE protein